MTKPSPQSVNSAVLKKKRELKYNDNIKTLKNVLYHCPKNNKLSEIYLKIIILNELRSIKVYYPYELAKHIYELKIDKKLKKKELDIVEQIANIKINNNVKKYYVFATKYCSWHNSKFYPMFDSYVEKALKAYRKKGEKKYNRDNSFFNFKNDDLKNYKNFVNIIKNFKSQFGLNRIGLIKIDCFLWKEGERIKKEKK